MQHCIFSLFDDDGKIGVRSDFDLLPTEYQMQMDFLLKIYEQKCFIGMYDNKLTLKHKHQRTCRFCNKSYPDVKFSNRAHIIPELLGNKNLLSDFECDSCNSRFGKYENDLANFLGPFRTAAAVKGKNGVPKYRSTDNQLTITKSHDNSVEVAMNDDPENHISVEGDVIKIQSKSNPYKPINIYKSFLKSAISFVDDDEIGFLSNTIRFLSDDSYTANEEYDSLFTMVQNFIPGNIHEDIFVLYYKKRPDYIEYPAPSLVFMFYIKNLVLQLVIPFHDMDYALCDMDSDNAFYTMPPLLMDSWIKENGRPFTGYLNLNKCEVIKNDDQVFCFQADSKK